MSVNSDIDIDDLVLRLDNLFTSQQNRNSLSMANPTPAPRPIEYQLLRLYIDNIPKYDGNPNTLGIFIDNCETLIATFSDEHNPQINQFILRAIISKLVGRALILIGSRIELRTWNDIKNALNLSFSDQRNIDCLEQDLINLRPLKNETPYNFGMRCQDARSLIISKLNTLGFDDQERMIRINNYNSLALRTFLRGLSGQIQNNVRLRNPDSLEKAMSLVIEEENFMYSQYRTNTLNSQATFKPMTRLAPINFNQQQPKNFQYNTTQQIQRPLQTQHFTQPQFPQTFRNPIFQQNTFRPQFTPQPQIKQPFINNAMQQNIQNPFRPNNNFSTQRNPYFLQRPSQIVRNQQFPQQNKSPQSQINRFKPEPMDTSSSNSKLPPQKTFAQNHLFAQDINEFENPFENQNYECYTAQENYLETDSTETNNLYDYNQFNFSNNNFEEYNSVEQTVQNEIENNIPVEENNVNFPQANSTNSVT